MTTGDYFDIFKNSEVGDNTATSARANGTAGHNASLNSAAQNRRWQPHGKAGPLSWQRLQRHDLDSSAEKNDSARSWK